MAIATTFIYFMNSETNIQHEYVERKGTFTIPEELVLSALVFAKLSVTKVWS
jgi:hypothetical protein